MSKDNYDAITVKSFERNCTRPTVLETTALGLDFGRLAVGVWESPQAISDAWQVDQQFSPELHPSEIKTIKGFGHRLYKSSSIAKNYKIVVFILSEVSFYFTFCRFENSDKALKM